MNIGIGMLTILLAFALPFVVLIGAFALAALKVLKGDGPRRSKGQAAEETRMIQAIYHQLSRMEDRIEALETLLLDRERKDVER